MPSPLEVIVLVVGIAAAIGAAMEPFPALGILGAIAVIAHFLFSISVGRYARRLNRSRNGWLLFSICISPIIAYAFLRSLPFHPRRKRPETSTTPLPGDPHAKPSA